MDNTELSKRLRALSTKGSSYRRTICKMAAQRLERQSEQLQSTKTLISGLLPILKRLDLECELCDHRHSPPCVELDDFPACDQCKHDCYCKDCKENSEWECKALQEVLT